MNEKSIIHKIKLTLFKTIELELYVKLIIILKIISLQRVSF